jgi:hypothetical protein
LKFEVENKPTSRPATRNSPTAAVHSRGIKGSNIEEQRSKINTPDHSLVGWGSSFFDFRSLTKPQGGESRWSSLRLRQRKLVTTLWWAELIFDFRFLIDPGRRDIFLSNPFG